MTCIVGLAQDGQVWIGADACAAANSRFPVVAPKVFTRNDDGVEMLIGYTTSFRFGQILEYELALPRGPHNDDVYGWMVRELVPQMREASKRCEWDARSHDGPGAAYGGDCLVAFRGRLFRVASDYAVHEFPHYHAIGCGEDYALGSLATTSGLEWDGEKRVRAALQAAVAHNGSVMEPFTVLSLGDRTEEVGA